MGGCSNRAAEAVASKTDLTYNPERLKILNLSVLREMIEYLRTKSDENIRARYTKIETRKGLSLVE